MARKKNFKALFEVLSRTETTMSVPDWMKGKPAGDAAAPGTEIPGPEEDETPPPPGEVNRVSAPDADAIPPEAEDETAASPEDEIDVEVETEPEPDETIEYEEPEPADEADDSDEFADAETPEPIVEAPPVTPKPRRKHFFGAHQAADKVARFSMNPRNVVILLVAAGVLLLVAFVLGRWTADRVGTEPASPQAKSPTNSAERRSVIVDDAPMTCVSGQRDPDRFFLMIQTLRGNGDADKVEAERMIEFCKERGLPADMVELQRANQSRVAVWCLLGYRFANSKPALDHVRKVEEIGQAYFNKYQTYTFQQRRTRDGSLRPFFVPGKVEQPIE